MRIKIRENQMEDIRGMTTEYPYVMHYDDDPDLEVPWHWHEEMEFNYIIKGQIKIITTDNEYVFREGEGCFVNSNVLSKYEIEKGTISVSHLFHSVFLSGHYKSIYETKYINPIVQNKKLKIVSLKKETQEQRVILSKLKKLTMLQREKNVEMQTRNMLSDIWLLLISEVQNMEMKKASVPSVMKERLLNMLQFIHNHYAEKITLEDIAGAAMISTRECLRCFNQCLKETPIEYLTNYRIDRAKALLKETDDTMIDIAMATGFSDGAYFAKMFKKTQGVTPKMYRKIKREQQ